MTMKVVSAAVAPAPAPGPDPAAASDWAAAAGLDVDLSTAPAPAADKRRRARARWPLSVLMGLVFACEVLLSGAAVFAIVYFLSRQVIDDVARSARDIIVAELKASVRSEVLLPLMRAVRGAAALFEAGTISPARPDEMLRAFAATIADAQSLAWIYLGTDTGHFWGTERVAHADGTFDTWRFAVADPGAPFRVIEYPLGPDGHIAPLPDLNMSFVPSSRPWYKAARAARGAPAWTSIYSHFTNPEVLDLTVALEASVDGSSRPADRRYGSVPVPLPLLASPAAVPHAGAPPLGASVVLGADTGLRDVPRLLAAARVTSDSLLFVVDAAGLMVATNRHSAPELVLRDPRTGDRYAAAECPEPLVRASAAAFAGLGPGAPLPARLSFAAGGDTIHLTVRD